MGAEDSASLIVDIKVIPRASKSEVIAMQDGTLRVRLTSPPVDGAANHELIKLLSKTLHIARTDIEIIGGETSRSKRLRLWNISKAVLDKLNY